MGLLSIIKKSKKELSVDLTEEETHSILNSYIDNFLNIYGPYSKEENKERRRLSKKYPSMRELLEGSVGVSYVLMEEPIEENQGRLSYSENNIEGAISDTQNSGNLGIVDKK